MIVKGEHSYCADWHEIECYELTRLYIGKFCSIGSGLKIMSGQHPQVEHPLAVSQYPFKEQMNLDYFPCKMDGEVHIGNDVWIGTNVTILDGVTIGDGATIGAHAVVSKDVHPYTVVVGNPAEERKYKFLAEQIEKLLEIKWWDWDINKIKEAVPLMKDINKFIERYG
jgi:acetyltransferase-like isoleucine patch superfamily enzyme